MIIIAYELSTYQIYNYLFVFVCAIEDYNQF
jgi:hypothetical protein